MGKEKKGFMKNFAMLTPTQKCNTKRPKRFFGFAFVWPNVKRSFGWIAPTPVNPTRKAFSFIWFVIVYDRPRKHKWEKKDGVTYWSIK